MKLCDSQSAKVEFTLRANPAKTVLVVPFKDDQTDSLCSASEDGSIYKWNLTSLQHEPIAKHDGSIVFMAQSKDGSLCTASRRKIGFWSSRGSGNQPKLELAPEEADIRCVILLRDGRVCYATDLAVKIWDFKSETVIIRSDDERSEAMSLFQLEDGSVCLVSKRSIRKSDQVTPVVESDDYWSWTSASTLLMDGRLCVASDRGEVHVVNLEAGCIDLTWEVLPVTAVLQLRDGNVCIASMGFFTIQIRDVSSGRQLRFLQGHTDKILSLIQLADGRICSSSSDKSIRLWRTEKDSFVPPSPVSKPNSPPFKQKKNKQSTPSEKSAAKIEPSQDPQVRFQFVTVAKFEPSKFEPSVLIIRHRIKGSLIRCEIHDSIAILMAADNFLISLNSDANVKGISRSLSLDIQDVDVEIQKNSKFGDVYMVRFVKPQDFSALLQRAKELGLKPFPNYLLPAVSCVTGMCPGRSGDLADGYSSFNSPFGIHYDPELVQGHMARTVNVGLLDFGFGNHDFITRHSRAKQPFVDFKCVHGTHCAGLIAANNNPVKQMRGVADNAFLVYMRLEYETWSTDQDNEMDEIMDEMDDENAHIIEKKLKDMTEHWYTSAPFSCLDEFAELGIEVLNISINWGDYFHDDFIDNMLDAIRQSMRRVIKGGSRLVVVSAGNDGRDLDSNVQNSPERIRFVDVFAVLPTGNGQDLASCMISVAASDVFGHLAHFSNYGKETATLAALGESVLSTMCYLGQWEGNKYQDESGTSMSAPLVSGALAVLIARFPDATKTELKQRLIDTADKEVTLLDKCVAGGRLNLNRALRKSLFGPFGVMPMPDISECEAKNIQEIIRDIDSIENALIEVHRKLEMAFIGHMESEQDRLSNYNPYYIWNESVVNRQIISNASKSLIDAARDKLEVLRTDSEESIDRLMEVEFEFIPTKELRNIALEWKESEIQRLRNSMAFNQQIISEWDTMLRKYGAHNTFLRFWARHISANVVTVLNATSSSPGDPSLIVAEIQNLIQLYEIALSVASVNLTRCEEGGFLHLFWGNEVKWIQRQIFWWKEKCLYFGY